MGSTLIFCASSQCSGRSRLRRLPNSSVLLSGTTNPAMAHVSQVIQSQGHTHNTSGTKIISICPPVSSTRLLIYRYVIDILVCPLHKKLNHIFSPLHSKDPCIPILVGYFWRREGRKPLKMKFTAFPVHIYNQRHQELSVGYEDNFQIYWELAYVIFQQLKWTEMFNTVFCAPDNSSFTRTALCLSEVYVL